MKTIVSDYSFSVKDFFYKNRYSIVVLISLHCYAPDIGHLNMTFGQISFSAGFYIVFAFLIAFLFILSFFKKIFLEKLLFS